jgi:hypothetical protein
MAIGCGVASAAPDLQPVWQLVGVPDPGQCRWGWIFWPERKTEDLPFCSSTARAT